ncbi:hypothetical protein ACWN8V_10615 [Vagococcus elongatus]|uniref:hypothetical protein n=1 Tax=Vagococcus elongatus TaxID=180344 RepID=UPI001FE4EEAC|nr:hypothetical protein [Vagococcus elongatus]
MENIKNNVYDIVISMTQVPKGIEDKVTTAIQLSTGIGAEAVCSIIKRGLLE